MGNRLRLSSPNSQKKHLTRRALKPPRRRVLGDIFAAGCNVHFQAEQPKRRRTHLTRVLSLLGGIYVQGCNVHFPRCGWSGVGLGCAVAHIKTHVQCQC